MYILFCNKLPQICHPLLVGASVHEASPLADEDGCNILFFYIEPVVVPGILIERLVCESALEPRLLIYERTIVVR